MIEIADIRAKPAKSPLKEDSIFEGDLPFESKQLTDAKWYLDVTRESNAGAMTFKLYLPPYDID
jgi:hypothetical protein